MKNKITSLLIGAMITACTTPPQSTPVPVECGKCCDGYKIPDSLLHLDTSDIFGSPYPYAYQGVIWYTKDSTGPDPEWIPDSIEGSGKVLFIPLPQSTEQQRLITGSVLSTDTGLTRLVGGQMRIIKALNRNLFLFDTTVFTNGKEQDYFTDTLKHQ